MMKTNVSRVYINPNFSGAPNSSGFQSNVRTSRNHLHVNPYYSSALPSEHQNINLNRRIYVNPNFIKSNSISDNIVNQYSGSERNTHQNDMGFKDYNYANKDNVHHTVKKNTSPSVVSNSKYRLIRNNVKRNSDKNDTTMESCTIKISKYKSIPIRDFKSIVQTTKPETPKKPKESGRNIDLPPSKYVSKTSLKLIRQNKVITVHTPMKLITRSNTLKTKIHHDSSLQIRLKRSKNMCKKNNIPCRLFAKYGKCLRNLSGTCQYVHDQKHVSLCRKFIKGICHDKSCLLSHELSSKKMPTCNFYLKGMCVKERCPYTHVKVSDKSKICQDFLKGYCDKGDTCLYRHLILHPSNSNYKQCVNDNSKHNALNKILTRKSFHSIKNKTSQQYKQKHLESEFYEKSTGEQEKQEIEGRYFKEDLNNEDNMCENLKPSRCKLGTLPSFIQL